jgi:hypothetical protein
MSANAFAIGLCGLAIVVSPPVFAQQLRVVPSDDPTRALVGRLDLERYKATIRGLGQFGDRQQGTDRNRAAVDWIEAELRGYGCSTERIRYVYNAPGLPRDQQVAARPPGAVINSGEIVAGLGGARMRTQNTSIHVGAEDIRFVRPCGADLCAIDLLARPRSRRPLIQRAQPRIGLRHRIVVGRDRQRDARHPGLVLAGTGWCSVTKLGTSAARGSA